VAEKAAREAEELAHDMHTVKNELHRYKDDGISPEGVLLDLVNRWDSCEQSYPLMYKVVLDILPVQASAVTRELIFSSRTSRLHITLDGKRRGLFD